MIPTAPACTHNVLRTLLALLASATLAATASAGGPIIDVGGFEDYSAAALEGQPEGPYVWQAAGGAGSATVQSSIVASGAQAVRVDKAPNSDKRWGIEVAGFPTGRFIMVDWDMRVMGSGGAAFGPFFGVETYDADVAMNQPFRLLGSWGVDATTGDVLYQAPGSGAFVETGEVITFGQWNHYRILLDFAQSDYSVYLDGDRIATVDFVDPGNAVGRAFTDADISALAAGADPTSMATPGVAYFDNFIVRDGIPGDFNQSGNVSSADFATWKAAFGTGSGADSDGDSDSDGADFLIWQRELGTDLFAATPVGVPTPEPSAAALLGLAIASLAARRRRTI